MRDAPPAFTNHRLADEKNEATPGVPLAGLGVKVASNLFLITLSTVEGDIERNIQLMNEQSWFDIPILYDDGRRAIIAIEKGPLGERAFSEAFAIAWSAAPDRCLARRAR